MKRSSPSLRDDDSIVRIRNINFGYGGRLVLDHIDLDIARGKVTAIMGPSGCGKTTLLRLIGGELLPTEGTIEVDGLNVSTLKRKDLFALRQRIGMLFQNGALLTDMSAADNVSFPLRRHTKLPESMIRDIVLMKLEAVGLRGARDILPVNLSGGMARRVALARAIALDPMMVMYDEPFTGQDPISMGVLMHLIRTLNDELGMSSIIVSHSVDEVMSISDFVYLLSAGKVVDHGTPQQLRESSSKSTQQFLHGLPDGPVAFNYKACDYATDLMRGSG